MQPFFFLALVFDEFFLVFLLHAKRAIKFRHNLFLQKLTILHVFLTVLSVFLTVLSSSFFKKNICYCFNGIWSSQSFLSLKSLVKTFIYCQK